MQAWYALPRPLQFSRDNLNTQHMQYQAGMSAPSSEGAPPPPTRRATMPLSESDMKVLDTQAAYGPIQDAPSDLTESDMMTLLSAYITGTGLIGYSVGSFNDFLENGVYNIMSRMFKIDITSKNVRPTNAGISHFGIVVNFPSAEVGYPSKTMHPSGQTGRQLPNEARNARRTYSAPLVMSAEIAITAHMEGGGTETKTATVDPYEVSQIPIMVGSSRCHTYQLPREARKQLQEDPREQGGYFIVKGVERSVELLENIRFNSLHAYLNVKPKEVVRGEFISQPGGAFENSSQIILRHLKNNMITIEVNSMKFVRLQIPFYLIFRMFGMVDDNDIIAQVVGDPDSASPVDGAIRGFVHEALHIAPAEGPFSELKDVLDRQKICDTMAVVLNSFVTDPNTYKSNEDAIRYLTAGLMNVMDKVFLPHMGQTPADRTVKLRFVGRLIYKMMLVELGIVPPTDRDSFEMKRVHGSGISLAKAFKAMVNRSVVSTVVSSLKRELQQGDWAKLTERRLKEAGRMMFTTSSDLNRLLAQCITSGNTVIIVRRRAMMNRVASSAIERKSPLNLISALRRVTAHNASSATKGTERAELIRAVHPTSMGYICPYHSADTGEKVGLEKQLACTADISDAGDIEALTARLRSDPEIRHLSDISSADISTENLCPVYANGVWIGCCQRPDLLVARYQGLRRQGRVISPRTTVWWNLQTNEVEFWLDVGRITRPLLIVDNNSSEFKAGARRAFSAKTAGDADWEKHKVDFVQNVRFTSAHAKAILAGDLTVDDLVEAGIVEYVTPEEMTNCLLAPSISHLYDARNDILRPYTHCDIPQALSGLAALVSPFANHTQPARVTYETNQARQTCGWYCGSWPFRADQQRFVQFYCESPLVRTISAQYVLPSGMNCSVAYATIKGDNQEDSAVISLAACQRGLFAGLFFRRQEVELNKGEQFGTPDASITRGMKRQASYAKLVNGFVPIGTRVCRGDVLVGRTAKETRVSPGGRGGGAGSMQFVDRSVVYNLDEPAYVDAQWVIRGDEDEQVAIIRLRYYEPVNIGDKQSSRSGNKSITARALPESELPYDENGCHPDVFINPHSIPTRMVIGQMIEATVGQVLARVGATGNGTMFLRFDPSKLGKMLASVGLRESGHTTMYNPRTGMPIDAAIFVGPTFQQRLQKFVDFIRYVAPANGPTDALTGQPLDGKKAGGGLRWGEMEGWVLASIGAMATYEQKIRNDSDGRDAYYCRTCGQQASYNPEYGINRCYTCGEMADIVCVQSRQASIVFQQEMRAAGIHISVDFAQPRFSAPE
jgi:DNA-directed RNA polymerase beta subunit